MSSPIPIDLPHTDPHGDAGRAALASGRPDASHAHAQESRAHAGAHTIDPLLQDLIARAEADGDLTRDEIAALLACTDRATQDALCAAAYRIKRAHTGDAVFFRGLVEFSNVCVKDCLYCGIRRSAHRTSRYTMEVEEIVDAALWAHEQRFGSVVLQSGERSDPRFVDLVAQAVEQITVRSGRELGITLSCGEQEESVYRRWYDAGAQRYLLRVETSNPMLYAKLHPESHSHARRIESLRALQRVGYMTGTGVMIGLPYQTMEDLADDILFFRALDIDMIGMGPYLACSGTPLADIPCYGTPGDRLELSLRMIALTRLMLRNVNIASTTALQAIEDDGRERGLLAGANVIMPNVTDVSHRPDYTLYDGKPCLDENAAMCIDCLELRIQRVGERIAWGRRGDPLHFTRRTS